MKIPYKHIFLLMIVIIALVTIFLPMIWERDLYPKHLLIRRHAEKIPTPLMDKMPDFSKMDNTYNANNAPFAWVIQLASLNNKKNAIALETQLRQKKYPAFLVNSRKDPAMINIMVGPYAKRDIAKKESQKLDLDFNVKSIVTKYQTAQIKELKR